MHIESFLDSALLFTFGVDQIDCVPGLRHQVMPTRRWSQCGTEKYKWIASLSAVLLLRAEKANKSRSHKDNDRRVIVLLSVQSLIFFPFNSASKREWRTKGIARDDEKEKRMIVLDNLGRLLTQNINPDLKLFLLLSLSSISRDLWNKNELGSVAKDTAARRLSKKKRSRA